MKRLVALAATLLLAGCGGGVYIGWGNWDDGAPSVSITTAQTSVPAGGTLHVVAAASDNDSGIDEVAFYRVDGGTDTRLGSDGSAPYDWNVAVPADGRTRPTAARPSACSHVRATVPATPPTATC